MNNEFNNQNNGEQQVISVEKKKGNVLAILGLGLAFFIPIVGLILSIVGLNQSKKLNDGKGLAIGGIVASFIVLILQIVFLMLFILVLVFDDSDFEYDYTEPDYYREEIDYSDFSDSGGKFYFLKGEDDHYYLSTSFDKKDNLEFAGEYDCSSANCRVFSVAQDYAVLYDNKEYFLYDYKKNKMLTLDIPYQKYINIYMEVDKKDNIRGLTLYNSMKSYAFYDIKSNELVINFSEYSDIRTSPDLLEAGYIILVSDNTYGSDKTYLYNLSKKRIERENIVGAFSNGKVTYFYESIYDDEITKIYSEDFKLLVDASDKSIYSFYFDDNDGKLLYGYNNKYYIIEDGKIVYTSNKYKEVYNVLKDYVVVNKDNNLLILDYKEKEVANLATLNDDMYVHYMLSGWYTENGKNGVYIVVEDKSITCDTVDHSFLENYYEEPYQQAVKTCDDNSGKFGYEYYYIPTTKEINKIETIIGMYAKPVLYLYPENDNTKVKVSFENSKLLTTTYPKYNKYWQVIANKNGDLIDEKGRSYYGLYWEELGSTKVDFHEGFYVEKDDAIDFLEEKLDLIGLTEREANEFMMYWLPILENNEKSLVYFELTAEREKFNKLIIEPKPDSMLRMAIHVKKVNEKKDIQEQKLSTFKRHGFSAVEWGGVMH